LRFRKTGLVGKGFYVTGLSSSACYLLDGEKPVLFDAGYTCAGRLYEEGIRQVLKERVPEILFLTHVHYDHCGAANYLKRVFPGLKVAGSERAAQIMRRPNAQKLMVKLNGTASSFIARSPGVHPSKLLDEPFQPFHPDLILGDGDVVELGGTTVQVIATPGHTRDLLSYYIPERKILIGTEATGNEDRTGRIIMAPLTNYDTYISSIKRIAALPAEILCTGHDTVWVGADAVQDYFARAISATEAFREKVEQLLHEEDGSVDRVVARIKAEEYDTNRETWQPEAAYLINVRAKVDVLAKRLKSKEPVA
jgi:glyoxylase-like metal-dependent hydrolase (beta-lactamase superfamily II)